LIDDIEIDEEPLLIKEENNIITIKPEN